MGKMTWTRLFVSMAIVAYGLCVVAWIKGKNLARS